MVRSVDSQVSGEALKCCQPGWAGQLPTAVCKPPQQSWI
jgi:hypothetical protein